MTTRQKNPRLTKKLYRQACSFYDAALYPQAVELFDQLLASPGLYGQLARFYHGRACRKSAEALMQKNNYQAAGNYLKRALKTNPNSPTLLSFLAQCHIKQQQYAPAATDLRQLARVSDSADEVRYRQALNFYLAGKTEQAIDMLEQLVKGNPGSFDVNFQLGTILAAESQSARAIQCLTQASLLRPEDVQCHWRLALAHGVSGHILEAVNHLQRAHKLDPANNWVLNHLTLAADQARRQGFAIDIDIQPAEKADKNYLPQPTGELSQLILDEPEFVTAFLDLPPSKLDNQIFDAVAAILENALEKRGHYADLHYYASAVQRRLGNIQQAIEHAQAALEINPRYAKALIHLASLYVQTGKHQQAIERLETAIVNGADYADVHCTLGKLYQQQGYVNKARVNYTRALTLNENYHEAKKALATLAA